MDSSPSLAGLRSSDGLSDLSFRFRGCLRGLTAAGNPCAKHASLKVDSCRSNPLLALPFSDPALQLKQPAHVEGMGLSPTPMDGTTRNRAEARALYSAMGRISDPPKLANSVATGFLSGVTEPLPFPLSAAIVSRRSPLLPNLVLCRSEALRCRSLRQSVKGGGPHDQQGFTWVSVNSAFRQHKSRSGRCHLCRRRNRCLSGHQRAWAGCAPSAPRGASVRVAPARHTS